MTIKSFDVKTLQESSGQHECQPNRVELFQREDTTYEVWFTGTSVKDEKTILRTADTETAEIVYDSIKKFTLAVL